MPPTHDPLALDNAGDPLDIVAYLKAKRPVADTRDPLLKPKTDEEKLLSAIRFCAMRVNECRAPGTAAGNAAAQAAAEIKSYLINMLDGCKLYEGGYDAALGTSFNVNTGKE